MLITNYEQFLLETIIQTSEDFRKILNAMEGDKVADILIEILPDDIKTNYNFIKLSNEVGKLSFLPDAQATRKLQSGATEEELFAAASNPTTINRMVKSILSANKIDVSDVSLELFGNKFKAMMSLYTNKELDIREVKGEEIKKWYLQDNYSQSPRATLHTSCMRYDSCQEYFDIYIDNPEVVSLIILVNKEGKLEARALFWKTEQGLYLDRVYFSHPTQNELLNNWAKLKYGEINSYNNLSGKRLSVQLKNYRFDLYPYIDTFCYLVGNTLQNWEPSSSQKFIILQDTSGGYDDGNRTYSEYEDRYINTEDAVHSERYGWLSDARYSDWLEDYLPSDLAVRSRTLSSWIDANNSVKVILEDRSEDNVPDDWSDLKSDFVLDYHSYKWYHNSLKSDLEELGGKWYLKGKAMTIFDISNSEKSAIFETYTGQGTRCTKLDKEVFDIVSQKEIVWSISEVAEIYERSWYKNLIKIIEEQDCDREIKDLKLAEQSKFHQILMKTSRRYKCMNEELDKLGSFEAFENKWKGAVDERADLIKGWFESVKSWWPEPLQNQVSTDQIIDLIKNIDERRNISEMSIAGLGLSSLLKNRVKDALSNIVNKILNNIFETDIDLFYAFMYFKP